MNWHTPEKLSRNQCEKTMRWKVQKTKHMKLSGKKPTISLIRFPEGKYKKNYMKDIPRYRVKKPNETQGK